MAYCKEMGVSDAMRIEHHKEAVLRLQGVLCTNVYDLRNNYELLTLLVPINL